MRKIHYYRDKGGHSDVEEYLEALSAKGDKDSRIKFNKIAAYVYALAEYGTKIGMPYVEHLEGEIWELRPIRDRIFFVAWTDGGFVLLHHFMKQTQKTPRMEIEQAKRELADLKERGLDNGEE
jgi:phage-related protein